MTSWRLNGWGCTDGSNQNEDMLAMKGAPEAGSLVLSEFSWLPDCEQAQQVKAHLSGAFSPLFEFDRSPIS